MGALEMWLWSVFWAFLWRVFRRMVRNAKQDLVAEVIALSIEAMKEWGAKRQDVDAVVNAAWEAPADDVKQLFSAAKTGLQSASPSLAPPAMPSAQNPPSRDAQVSKTPDRPTAGGAEAPNPSDSDPGRTGGGS